VDPNSPNQSAYVNYQHGELDGWENAYFGESYEKLKAIKEKYDPLGVFNKEYTVKGGRGR